MIFVFPGQGSQKIGMGKDIYDNFSCARNIFQEVDDAISFGLSKLIFEGTEDELKSTENAQPALMTVSMAFMEVLRQEFGFNPAQKAKFFAGHSLGEYTALCAANVISLKDAAKILRVRGKAMSEAYPTGGAMAAILGFKLELLEQIVEKISNNGGVVQIANDNSSVQVVISGEANAVQEAGKLASEQGARRVVLLPVSGPFHSKLMKPAADALEEILDSTEFNSPILPIISNITAQATTENFKDLLLQQITGRVRWRESMIYAESQKVSQCVEVGSGRVLTDLCKRIAPSLQLYSINSLETLREFCSKI